MILSGSRASLKRRLVRGAKHEVLYQHNEQARAALKYSSKYQNGKIRENRQTAGSTTASTTPRQQGGTGILPIEAAVEVVERGRKGRKKLELLILELALRFEAHNISLVQRSPPSHARIGQSRASSSYLSRDVKRFSSRLRSCHARRRCGRQLLKACSLEAANGFGCL